MSPARRVRLLPVPDRRARPAAAVALALLVAASVALPVLAVDPEASVAADASVAASASASPSVSPSTDASTSPSASPSTAPSSSPTASPSPSLSPGPSPSASPSPTPSPSPAASPSPTPNPSPTWPAMGWPTSATTLGASVTFYGRGWGHGVGLNQYGAKGRALGGQTAEQILAAYYKGAKTTTVSPTQNVRVLVLSGYTAVKSAPLVIHGRAKIGRA